MGILLYLLLFMFYPPYNLTVTEAQREWIENAIGWMRSTFGDEVLLNKPVLTPGCWELNIPFTQTAEDADHLLEVLVKVMDIKEPVKLDWYSPAEREVGASGEYFETGIFLQGEASLENAGGLYLGKRGDDAFHIELSTRNENDPNAILATLAHELSHIKLLGEGRIIRNNEHLTDLLIIIFGLGIFNSVEAFTYERTARSWTVGYSGYLSQMEWGYALALHSWLRGEAAPAWLKFVPADVEADFRRSMAFMTEHPELVMNFEFEGNDIPPHPDAPQQTILTEEEKQNILSTRRSAYHLFKENAEKAAVELYNRFKAEEKDPYVLGIAFLAQVRTKNFLQGEELLQYLKQNYTLTERQMFFAARFYSQQGKYETAIAYYDWILSLNPFDTASMNNLGFMLNRLKRYEEAIGYFNDALDIEPEFAFALNNRGLAKIETGDAEGGLADIKESLKRNPDNAYAYRNLGIYYMQQRKRMEALKNFEKAAELDPATDDIAALIDRVSG